MASQSNRYPLISVNPGSYDFNNHAETFSVQMSLIHNVFIRCLNSIWYHAPLVKKEDEEAFVGYCLIWSKIIHGHHRAEETIVFPFIQAKFDMSTNVDQHKGFLGPFEEFEAYLKSVSAKTSAYDGEKVRALVEAFGDTFVEHLHEEIPTISPERMKQFETGPLDAMISVHDEYIKSHSLVTDMVLVTTHHDISQVPNWPPAPAPIRWIIKNVTYWPYRQYWKFSPFSRTGEPQSLY
ncbi:hypothetical protein CVT24_010252 [Panaeolus cyanescens]|uniref:Hemerythrin-like domain-containing protein n=1 Tax=Panaeolus cyanescens TaxID=181874 RepID=A0A409YPB0_9AGAR|nr:hypothetical protein CVT24_010252 [Panaeolus cyanescens]